MTTTSRRDWLRTAGALVAAPALVLNKDASAEKGSPSLTAEKGLPDEKCPWRRWTEMEFIWDIPEIRFPFRKSGWNLAWEQCFNLPAGSLLSGYETEASYCRSKPFASICADFAERRTEFDEWLRWAAEYGIREIAPEEFVCDKNPTGKLVRPEPYREIRYFRIEPVDYIVRVTTCRPMTTLSLVQLLNLGYWLPRREFGIYMSTLYVSHKEHRSEGFYFAMRVPAHQMRAWIAETNSETINISAILGRWEHEGLEPVPVPPSTVDREAVMQQERDREADLTSRSPRHKFDASRLREIEARDKAQLELGGRTG